MRDGDDSRDHDAKLANRIAERYIIALEVRQNSVFTLSDSCLTATQLALCLPATHQDPHLETLIRIRPSTFHCHLRRSIPPH